MATSRTFTFKLAKACDLKINVSETSGLSFGMYTWPCAPVLAQYIWFNSSKFARKSVLELSAGTALPGLVAAKCGARVHLSDNPEFTRCLENIKRSCELNNITSMQLHKIQWGELDGGVESLPSLDFIISSDCFYNTRDFEDILVTVSFLLARNKDAEFVFTYQERSASRSVEHLLYKWDLDAVMVPLSNFDADSTNIAESGLPGHHSIKLFRVKARPS